jgi:hypothetical protein
MKGAAVQYSQDELAWIKARAQMARADLHALFAQTFGRVDVSVDNIKALCSRKGWTAGPEGRRRNKGKSLKFSGPEVNWLRQNGHLPAPELGPAFLQAFPRSDVTAAQLVGWRKRNKVRTGRTGRFEPGQDPWTKGKKLPFNAGSATTQFKPGLVPHNARPIGYETVNRDGYVLICVNRPNPFRPHQKTHMAFKHKEMWEAAHGPVPKGHALKCLDGNKANCAPGNWEAIPKGLLPRLNGKSGRDYDTAPAEVKPTILAVAKLEHAAKAAMKAMGELREAGNG